MAFIQISTFDEKVIATINTRHLDRDVLVKRVLKAVEQAEYVDWVTYEGDDGYEKPILDDESEAQEKETE
jgi:hypothetical protein